MLSRMHAAPHMLPPLPCPRPSPHLRVALSRHDLAQRARAHGRRRRAERKAQRLEQRALAGAVGAEDARHAPRPVKGVDGGRRAAKALERAHADALDAPAGRLWGGDGPGQGRALGAGLLCCHLGWR